MPASTLHHGIAVLFIGILLTACSKDPEPAVTAPPIKPFEAQQQALEQAKQLEQDMQTAAEVKRKEIEAQAQ